MSTTEVLERVTHVAVGLALLFSIALFARYTINPPRASASLSAASLPPHDAAPAGDSAPAVLDVSLTAACDR